jgi:hypothetical protein
MMCPECGTANPANYVSCSGCGARRVIDLGSSGSGGGIVTSSRSSGRGAHSANSPATTAPQRLVINPGGRVGSGVPAGSPMVASQIPAMPSATGSQRFARDITRYLCVAVQIDSQLNREMIESTMGAGARAVASSPGVDLATVIKYGLAARHRQLMRDVLLLVLAFLTLVLFIPTAGASFVIGYLLAVCCVFGEQLYTAYGVVSPLLRRAVFDPARAPEPSSPEMRRRISEIASRDRGNVTVFGRYEPFIGRGVRFSGFEFALSLRPKEGHQARTFTLNDAHDHVVDTLRNLGLPGVTVEDELFVSGEDLQDQLDGATMHLLLPDPMKRPVTTVDDAAMRSMRDDPKNRARPYIAVRIAGWSGELVVTVLLRLALARQGKAMYVETHYLLLPPVRERYRYVDRLSAMPTFRQASKILGSSLLRTPFVTLGACVSVPKRILEPVEDHFAGQRERREILHDRTFNYGSLYSVRESAAFQAINPVVGLGLLPSQSSYAYTRHFQQSDQKFYAELAASQIIGSLVEFLDMRGFDAAELATRQMTINNGTIMGNNANIKNAAFSGGTGSSASNRVGGGSKTATGK